MPRAAKDLMKRQLVMKKTAVKKRTVRKQKKTGKCEVHTDSLPSTGGIQGSGYSRKYHISGPYSGKMNRKGHIP